MEFEEEKDEEDEVAVVAGEVEQLMLEYTTVLEDAGYTISGPATKEGSMRSFLVDGNKGSLQVEVRVCLTNIVSRFHLTVADTEGSYWPCTVDVEKLAAIAPGVVRQPRKRHTATVLIEWRGMFRAITNMINREGHVACPGAHCENEAAINMHLLAKWLTDTTGVPMGVAGLAVNNHVCSFRCGFSLNLATLREEIRRRFKPRKSRRKADSPWTGVSERVWPNLHLSMTDPRRNILMMFFERGSVTCTGIRRVCDFEETCEMALAFCCRHPAVNKGELATI